MQVPVLVMIGPCRQPPDEPHLFTIEESAILVAAFTAFWRACTSAARAWRSSSRARCASFRDRRSCCFASPSSPLSFCSSLRSPCICRSMASIRSIVASCASAPAGKTTAQTAASTALARWRLRNVTLMLRPSLSDEARRELIHRAEELRSGRTRMQTRLGFLRRCRWAGVSDKRITGHGAAGGAPLSRGRSALQGCSCSRQECLPS